MSTTSQSMDNLGIAHATIRLSRDEDGRLRECELVEPNATFSVQTGIADAPGGADALDAVFGAYADEARASFGALTSDGPSIFPLYCAGVKKWFSCHARLTGPDTASVVFVDVTDYRAESAMMELRERAYRSFIEHLQMIAFLRVVSPEPISLFIAGSFREITGYGPEQGANADAWLEIVHPDDRPMVEAEARRLHTHPDYDEELEYRIVRRDGQIRWVRSYDRQFTADDGRTQLVQGLIIDVTERKEQEEALREANERIQEQNQLLARLARTDALTGLLNRRAMQEQLERELRLFSRGRRPFSILLIDLDDFKGVNDRHGHRAGDRVLVHLAQTLGDHLRSSDVTSRWGGEEFMVLLTETEAKAALNVAGKLRSWFHDHPADVDGQRLPVTFTGGLVEAKPDDTVDTLFSRADQALYQGKNAGRNRIVAVGADGSVVEEPADGSAGEEPADGSVGEEP